MNQIGSCVARLFRVLTLALVAIVVLVAQAGAAIEVKQRTVSEGLGGFGDATTKSTQIISADKSFTENENKYTGRFKTFAGGKKKSITITRLDLELLWNIDPKKKQYSETTFAEMREILSGKRGPFGLPQSPEMEEQPEEPDAVEMDCSIDVSEPNEAKKINGFQCKNVVLTIRCDPQDAKLAAEQGMKPHDIVYDMWLAHDVEGLDVIQAFQKNYLDKIGLGTQIAGGSGLARRLLSTVMDDLKDKLKQFDGYPILTTLLIKSAPLTDEQQKAMDEAMAKAEEADAEAQEDAQKDAVSDGASGDVAGGASGLITSKIGGFFSKKARDGKKKKGDKPVFKLVTEVTSIKKVGDDDQRYEVINGFKKTEKPW